MARLAGRFIYRGWGVLGIDVKLEIWRKRVFGDDSFTVE
jgi:hypothetical protein